ncbi:hypothetical protein DND90_01135 [Pseudomonas syringae pv. maculicola]|nr:hypothetical protein DND90_01135 [Pseudomonas syringae pv. maculicola]
MGFVDRIRAFLAGLLEARYRLARKLGVKIGFRRTVAVANPISILGFEQQLDASHYLQQRTVLAEEFAQPTLEGFLRA